MAETVYVTPGHPVKEGAGYDCACGECVAVRNGFEPAHPVLCTCVECFEGDDDAGA